MRKGVTICIWYIPYIYNCPTPQSVAFVFLVSPVPCRCASASVVYGSINTGFIGLRDRVLSSIQHFVEVRMESKPFRLEYGIVGRRGIGNSSRVSDRVSVVHTLVVARASGVFKIAKICTEKVETCFDGFLRHSTTGNKRHTSRTTS